MPQPNRHSKTITGVRARAGASARAGAEVHVTATAEAHARNRTRAASSSTRSAVAAISALLLSLSGLTACGEDNTAGKEAVAIGGTFEFVSPGGKNSIHYAPNERQPIGTIRGESLQDGSPISLDDYRGKVVILNSWGQWCGPCRSESDDLQRIQEKLQKNGKDAAKGTVLGINVKDPVREKPAAFVRDNGITYPSLYDPAFKSALAMGGVPASVIPTTIVLDKQHRPAHIFLKEITEEELWKVVEPELDAPDPQ